MQFTNSEHRIAVVGDLIVDHNIFVEPSKIAQEAPIIAYKVIRAEIKNGGAAAVSDMVLAMGCPSQIAFADAGAPVTKKTRYFSAGSRNPTIVARFDQDVIYEIDALLVSQLQTAMLNYKPHVIIASDYGKGVVSPQMMRMLRTIPNAKLIADPYSADWSKYRGADVILPSRAAAEGFLESEDDELSDFPAVVTKLDADGCRLYGAGPVQAFATMARSVVDVTGAGDQFAATLACQLRLGVTLPQAVWMANLAAGMQVERMGIIPVTAEELRVRAAQVGEMVLAAAE